MWLQCTDLKSSRLRAEKHSSLQTETFVDFESKNILFISHILSILKGSDVWNNDFTQIFGGLARLAGAPKRGRNQKGFFKLNEKELQKEERIFNNCRSFLKITSGFQKRSPQKEGFSEPAVVSPDTEFLVNPRFAAVSAAM